MGDPKKTTQNSQGSDAVLEKKARQLTDDFAKDPFIEKDSAAMDILRLRDTLKSIVQSESGEILDAAKDLLAETEQIIDSAKKAGKVASVAVSTASLTQQVHALTKQIGTLERKLDGYKAKYVADYQKNLTSFEQQWMGRFPSPQMMQDTKNTAKTADVRSWDDYMNSFLGSNVVKGREKESLAKAMSAVILKKENKPFSLEEADKLASNILKSKAFEDTFGKNGRLVEDYLKNRNISQAILLMDAQVDKDAVKKLQKEQDVKYKEFNKFLKLHPALKLGYEVMSQKDVADGTDEAQRLINEYHQAKSEGDEMTEARIMTKLLKEADPVLQAARNNPDDPKALKAHLEGASLAQKDAGSPVLVPKSEHE